MRTLSYGLLTRLKSHINRALVGITLSSLLAVSLLGYLHQRQRKEIGHLMQAASPPDGPSLSSVITELKRQIAEEEEHAAATNEADILTVKDIDLEISFTIKEEKTIEGKFEPKLIAVTNTNALSAERIQKLIFHLAPSEPRLAIRGTKQGFTSTPPPPKRNK